jgi:Na+/H+-dicarboxylate symporter
LLLYQKKLNMKKEFKMQSWQKVLIGMILGIITGLVFGSKISSLEYLGIFFLNMIKMVTVPLIFFTIIYGITSVESYSGVGRISAKAIVIFLCTAVVAALIGLVTASIIKPGDGEHKNEIIKMISDASKSGAKVVSEYDTSSLPEFLVNIIPSNVIDAAAKGNILQIIVFGFFCGILLNKNRSKCEELIKIMHQIAQTLFSMIETIMKFAPIGVFGYMASLVAVDGIGIMFTMAELIVTVVVGCVIQYLFFGIVILLIGRISPMPFYRKIFDIQLLAFSTSSSKAVLVPMMQKCEKELGISKEGSRFILPLSAALNMDGGAIYQVSCVIFFSQIYGITFGVHEYIIIILMSTIASIGGAGIPSGVLLFLGMVLHSVGMPMDGVLIVATIDRILDMFTTAINVTGDIFATIMVEISEKRLNKKNYNSKS